MFQLVKNYQSVSRCIGYIIPTLSILFIGFLISCGSGGGRSSKSGKETPVVVGGGIGGTIGSGIGGESVVVPVDYSGIIPLYIGSYKNDCKDENSYQMGKYRLELTQTSMTWVIDHYTKVGQGDHPNCNSSVFHIKTDEITEEFSITGELRSSHIVTRSVNSIYVTPSAANSNGQASMNSTNYLDMNDWSAGEKRDVTILYQEKEKYPLSISMKKVGNTLYFAKYDPEAGAGNPDADNEGSEHHLLTLTVAH